MATSGSVSRIQARTWMTLTALAGIAIGIFLSPMVAAAGSNLPQFVDANGNPSEHTLSVSGTGHIFVKPDAADVTLGVQVTRQTLKEAQSVAAQQMNDVLAAIHALGITDSDIETATLQMSPVYDYNSSQHITGYMVDNQITVHVKDLTKLASVVDDSVAAGATTVQGITFKVTDQTAAEAQARQDAVTDARTKADTLASAAGATISGIQSISETSYTPPVWYGSPMAGADQGAPTPIIPGQTDVSITVGVTYVIN